MKQLLLVEVNEDNPNELRMNIGTDDEMLLSFAIRKLQQAIDMHMYNVAMKKRATQTIVEPSQSIKDRLGL